jgi:predicted Zn-dependent peptidase
VREFELGERSKGLFNAHYKHTIAQPVCNATIHKLLREELVPEEELQLVRNYLSGSFLRGIDGPFALADRFAAILKYNQGYDYYETYFKKLKSIRPEELQQLALKYYADGSFFQVTAGS